MSLVEFLHGNFTFKKSDMASPLSPQTKPTDRTVPGPEMARLIKEFQALMERPDKELDLLHREQARNTESDNLLQPGEDFHFCD